MRHVIIEGPDGCGKTVLAHQLCDQHGFAYHHEGPPPTSNLRVYYARLLIGARRPTVFDRFHLGELVYGPLLRSGSALSSHDIKYMTRLIRGEGTIIIGCMLPWPLALDNTRAKMELIKDEDQLLEAYEHWVGLFLDPVFAAHCFIYDYSTDPSFQLEDDHVS